MSDLDHLRLKVAVIGGGVGGAYSAWRLVEGSGGRRAANGALRIALFEGSDRIGGRLYSLLPPGMSHLRAEVGGMRYLTTQPYVSSLIDELELPHRPFSQVTNRYYLRGQYLTEDDWRDPARVPYRLAEDERGKTPGELFLQVLQRICPEGLGATPQTWGELRRTGTFDGTLLTELGFWNAVMRVTSIEAYHALLEAYGHETMLGNWNAADILELTLSHRGRRPELRTLCAGMEQLPTRLAHDFENAGGTLYMRHRLTDIRPAVVPAGAEESHIELCFDTPDGDRKVYARHVILAMPRRSIELLNPKLFLFEEQQFQQDLRAVVPLHASKLFLGYNEPWWEQIGITEGSTDTDLPIRQCYYFGVEGRQPGGDPANRKSLLLATYNDGRSVDFWRAFVGSPLRFWRREGMTTLHPVEASDTLIREAQRQIRELHGSAAKVPDPYWSAFMDWSVDPYGGGWHTWTVHTHSDEVMRRMRQPRLDINLYIVGEAWSAEQGWIEGALTTSERVLQDKLGLEAPTWLRREVGAQS